MPPMSGVAGACFSGMSTMRAPMVMAVAAIEVAIWTASLVTLAGSMTPAFLRSIRPFSGVMTLTPWPGLAFSTSARRACELRPAFSII